MHCSTLYKLRRKDNGGRPLRLPAEPLAAYIDTLDMTNVDIAARCGVDESRIRHIRRRDWKSMNPGTVDRYCLALDIPMSHLYPEDDND